MKFYTNFFSRGSRLFVRGYTEGGIQVDVERELRPTLYTETKPKSFGNSESDQKSMFGATVYGTKFDSPKAAREFMKSYSDSNMRIWGYPRFDYAEIADMFPGVIEPDYNNVRVIAIDIETQVEHGWPDVGRTPEVINLISLSFRKKYFTFGCQPYTSTSDNETYVLCENEEDLLTRFFALYEKIKPDVVTGWNVGGFDLPYIYNRACKIMSESFAKRLSPFGYVNYSVENFKGKETHAVDISGLMILDYLELYKKFELSPRENYKLDTIAKVELGDTKLDYDCSFKELYTNHWGDKFVPYNIQDVKLIDRLDDKLGFIVLAMSIAYASKCNYNDVYRVTRVWDNIIANYLREQNTHVISTFRHHGDTYEGAYVKDTIPGIYEWCASFDVASLYPSLILGYNISPDTILPARLFPSIRADDVISRNENYTVALEIAKENNATLCANGCLFTKEKRGFLPILVEMYMKKRKDAKGDMKVAGRAVEAAKAELAKRGVTL